MRPRGGRAEPAAGVASPAAADEPAGRAARELAGLGQPLRRDRAARARRRVRPLDGRAEGGGAVVEHRLEPAAAARGVGVGDEHDRGAERLGADRPLAEPPREPRRDSVEQRLPRRARRRGDDRGDAAARQRPARRGGGRADRLLARRRILREQPHEPPPPPLALARRGGLLLRVALGRLRRQLVDVREDRLAERVDRVRREAAGDARLDEPAPREPRADAVRRQQRVEAAAGVELAAAEVDVRAPAFRGVRLGVGEQVDEAVERDLDAEPHEPPELALHRARVVRHLDGDRGDHLVRQAGQHGAEHVRGLRRDDLVRPRLRLHCHEATDPSHDRSAPAREDGARFWGITQRMSRAHKFFNLVGVLFPFLAFVVAIALLWNTWVDWSDLAVLAIMYVLTGYGVTLGFHRLLTHRSFQTYKPVEYALAAVGSMAVQGPVMTLGRRPPQAPRAHRQGRRPALTARPRRRHQGSDRRALVRAHGLAVRPRRPGRARALRQGPLRGSRHARDPARLPAVRARRLRACRSGSAG